MILTGPRDEAGEADVDEAADIEVWLETDAAEFGGSCSDLPSSIEASEVVGMFMVLEEAVALFCMSRLSSDTLETRETPGILLETAMSGVGGGASDAIRTEGLRNIALRITDQLRRWHGTTSRHEEVTHILVVSVLTRTIVPEIMLPAFGEGA